MYFYSKLFHGNKISSKFQEAIKKDKNDMGKILVKWKLKLYLTKVSFFIARLYGR